MASPQKFQVRGLLLLEIVPEDIAGAEILVRAAAEKSSIKIVVKHLNTEKRAKFTANVEVFGGEFLHGVDDLPPGEPSAL
jgi:hypothetical protein